VEIIEFSKGFEKLCFAFNNEFKEGQLLVYYEALRRWNVEAFNYAVRAIIPAARFFPKPVEIIDAMKDYRETIPPERQLESNEVIPDKMPDEVREALKNMEIGGQKIALDKDIRK